MNLKRDTESQRKRRQQDDEEFASGTLATLSRAPKYHPIRIHSVLQEQKVIVLVDSGATHNFIDEGLVMRMKLKAEYF